MQPQRRITPTNVQPGVKMTEATTGNHKGRSSAAFTERMELGFPLFLALVKKRYRLFLSCVVLGLLLGAVAALLPRTYETTGRMQVRPGSANVYKFDKPSLLGDDENAKLESEVAVLQSDTLLLQVAAELNLANNPDFMYRSPKGQLRLDDPETSELVLKRFSRSLSAQLLPRTEIITVTCTTRSAALSARIVNTLINDYIERLFKTRYASTQRVAGWLSSQLSDLNKEVESEQEQLVELQKKLGVVGIDKNHSIVATGLEGLTRAAGEAKVNRIIAEARYRILNNSDPNLIEGGAGLLTPPNTPSNVSLLATLRAQQAQLATRFAEVSAQFGPNYPEYKEIKAQLDEANRAVNNEQARVLSQSKNAFDAAKSNENMTSAALVAQESDAFRQRDDVVRYDILQHLYESNRQLYQGLVQRLREASIVSGLESSEVDVIDLARIHTRAAGLGRITTLALGLMLGLALGLGAVILSEALNTKIRTIGELEENSGLAPLGFIPLYKKPETAGAAKGRAGVPATPLLPEMMRSPKSLFSESIFGLRSALLLSAIDRQPQVILITSAKAAEGKSTIAENLSIALAQLDAPTLLIDCDLRRPTIRQGFALSGNNGLTSVLTARMTLEEAVQEVAGIKQLSVLPSGPLPPSPADTLASHRMADLIADAKERFTYIILDCPPALMVTDAVILSKLADAVVLVARLGQVDRFGVKRVSDLFRQSKAPLVGFVLNGVTPGAMGYGDDSYLYTSYEKD